jgi:serine/threonine-protein kinase
MTHPAPDTVVHQPPPPAAGELPHFDGYVVQELIGRGGMGKVYRAKHVALGRVVAIKVMTQEQDERLTARFREEARAVARLQHPNIAQLFDTGTADGRPYYSLEFADGGTLAGKWGGQPQDPRAAAAALEVVARAIQHSHEHGILHRDLKPGNVLLTADGTPKVADFGLAKELPSTAPADTTLPGREALTRTGEIVGTPAYMPPEQASGVSSSLSPAADVYSLGAVLYEALTGRPPFLAPDALQTLFLVLSVDPVPPKTLQPKLPPDLNTICMKCLDKQAKKRYATAGELADDLRRWLAGEPIVARPVGRVERAVKWAKRHKAGAALVAVSTLLLLAVVGFGVWEAVNALRLREANEQLAKKNEELEKANAELEKSRGETEMMLGYALKTMDEYHFTLSDKLATLPQGEKLRVEVLQQARTTLDELYAQNPRREAVWEHLMTGYQQLGNALSQVGDPDGGERAYARGAEAAGRLADRHPAAPRYRAARGTLLLQQTGALEAIGRTTDADAPRAAGLKLAAELDATHPDDLDVLKLNLLAVPYQHAKAVGSGDAAAMVPVYERFINLYHRLAAAEPDVPRHARRETDNELALAGLLAQLKRFDQAESTLTRTKRRVDTLPDADDPDVRQLRAGFHETVGTVAYYRDRPVDADVAYRKALVEYERIAKDFPNSPNYRKYLINCWTKIGAAGVFGGDQAVGLEAYQTARRLSAELVRDFPDNKQYKASLESLDHLIRGFTPPEKK